MNHKGLDTASVASHPSPARLAAFGLGALGDDESSTIAEHLSGCERCRSLFEAVIDDSVAALCREANGRRTSTTGLLDEWLEALSPPGSLTGRSSRRPTRD